MLKYDPVARVLDLMQGQQVPDIPVHLRKEDLLPMVSRSAYLGDSQPYGKRTRSGRLSRSQIETLGKLGITASSGDYVEKGLVTALTKNGPLDLEGIHRHVTAQLALARALPTSEQAQDLQELLDGVKLSRQAIAATINLQNENLLRNLRREQAVQYAQLGTLVLPPGLVSRMREPISFVDNTAQRLGRLVELMLL